MTRSQSDSLLSYVLSCMRHEEDSGTRSELLIIGRSLLQEYRILNYEEMKIKISKQSELATKLAKSF